jgi:hypothetical protein
MTARSEGVRERHHALLGATALQIGEQQRDVSVPCNHDVR